MNELEDIEIGTNINEDDAIIEESKQNNALDNKSVDVFNALNLVNEELGTSYQKDGYNPFDNDFVLTEEYANDILETKKTSGEIFTENFLDYSNKEVSKHFQNAIQNDNEILDKLNQELNNTSNENTKKQIKKAIVFLKNRNQLLKINIAKLKQKDANAIKMYIELYGLDSEISEILKDSFNEKANIQFMFQNMLNTCKFRATRIKAKENVRVEKVEQTTTSDILQTTQNKEPLKTAENLIDKNEPITHKELTTQKETTITKEDTEKQFKKHSIKNEYSQKQQEDELTQ